MHIERKIIIASIASTEFLAAMHEQLDSELFATSYSKLLIGWCTDYYNNYGKCPGTDIENIYYEALSAKKIDAESAEYIEDELLPELSKDAAKLKQIQPIIDQALKYLKKRKLIVLHEQLDVLLNKGEIDTAEEILEKYNKPQTVTDEVIFNELKSGKIIEDAFKEVEEPILKYTGAYGKFCNSANVRGAFKAYLAPEKRGKTAILLEDAMRGLSQGKKVAFFQAGDMTTHQMLRRIGIYTTKKTDKEKYSGNQYLPVKDCILNQLNICNKKIRECDFGIFEGRGWTEQQLRDNITMQDIIEAYESEQDYQPCYNCNDYNNLKIGSVYVKKQNIKMISDKEAGKSVYNWFKKRNKQLRLATYSNGTLSVKGIRAKLKTWATSGFVPDILIIDYADLLVPDKQMEFRHQQNQIWKDLRGVSQEINCLLITATQSDADSYNVDTLGLSNFSEDKRKYGHVTAMYGLNWDKQGREKKMGLMRINEIILRDDDFDTKNQVYVIQHRMIMHAIIDSFF